MDLMFDRICVNLPAGQECFHPDHFIQQPLHLRIQYVLEKKISFWLRGQEVELKAALSHYRKWSALRSASTTTRF